MMSYMFTVVFTDIFVVSGALSRGRGRNSNSFVPGGVLRLMGFGKGSVV